MHLGFFARALQRQSYQKSRAESPAPYQ